MADKTKTVLDHEHVFDNQYFPSDKFHVRRVCVLPGCCAVDVKNVKGA